MQDLEERIEGNNVLPFLSLSQTMKSLDCSRSFLYSLIYNGTLTPKHIGKKPYFMVEDIVALLEEKTVALN